MQLEPPDRRDRRAIPEIPDLLDPLARQDQQVRRVRQALLVQLVLKVQREIPEIPDRRDHRATQAPPEQRVLLVPQVLPQRLPLAQSPLARLDQVQSSPTAAPARLLFLTSPSLAATPAPLELRAQQVPRDHREILDRRVQLELRAPQVRRVRKVIPDRQEPLVPPALLVQLDLPELTAKQSAAAVVPHRPA